MNARTGDYEEHDRLPWLETAEEEYPQDHSVARFMLLAVLALAVIGFVAVGFLWYQRAQGVTEGNGELIKAPAGDYKVKPEEPGGMKVEGEGDSVFATSQGAASNSSINVGAVPEAPVQGTRAAAPGSTAPGTKTVKLAIPSASTAGTAAPAAGARPATARAGSGSLIQLGAFPNEAGANVAWARLSKRFGYLAPLGKSVERGEAANGNTVWRLRVNAGSNPQARELCGRLKVAGENCFIAN
ncbi:SPOR domain-containing protein [Sphingomonas psychrotolerans]|uniref:SPOR domain-containing protein n=1 Tax=Sphingomonas psychrotolerans TaxID=1327635 RepID=A0ABU3MYD9_9SPHN|nr:SPOR domain-containing protein [Sphingomonas psychrotolerans]MDT8757330.1 SPOR domain-containing protein [Sphingomonas psychrotolerans]